MYLSILVGKSSQVGRTYKLENIGAFPRNTYQQFMNLLLVRQHND